MPRAEGTSGTVRKRATKPSVNKSPKFRRLPAKTKRQIFADIDAGKSDTEIGHKYGTAHSNIFTYRQNREATERRLENLKPEATKPVKLKYPEVDKAMKELVDAVLEKGGNITGRMVQLQARKFAHENDIKGFTASNGWLFRFCGRHDLVFRVLQGEGASVNLEGLKEWYDVHLPKILEEYELRNIYNCDELGLNYRQLPNKSLVKRSEPAPKGSKLRKDRITVFLTSSATGEKLMPLIIGTSKNPRPFTKAGIRDGKTKRLGFVYKNNKTAWMDTEIFTEYLKELNAIMMFENRYIALILDNFKAHNIPSMSNVRLYFLPPNVTSHAQPLMGG